MILPRRLVAMLLLASAGLARADWIYDNEVDPMTSKRTDHAYVTSTESLNLDSPYSGRNFARLWIRQSARQGLNVIYKMDKGQFACGIDDCTVLVRFDDAPAIRFAGTPPADHSPNALFLSGAQNFVARARKARFIRVQTNIYHNGAPVMEFQASGLVWPPKK